METKPITHVTITGLKKQPQTFRWGTTVRIMCKHGMSRDYINFTRRNLRRDLPTYFKDFTLTLPKQ